MHTEMKLGGMCMFVGWIEHQGFGNRAISCLLATQLETNSGKMDIEILISE